MSVGIFSERHFINVGLAPAADSLAGTVDSDAVNTKLYSRVTFILIRAVGTTGTSTLTVLASSDASGTGATAIPFKSRTGPETGAALGALTARAAAGYTTVAGSNQIDVIEVNAADTPAGKSFVNLHAVEVVNDPVLAAILTILSGASYEEAVMPSAIV